MYFAALSSGITDNVARHGHILAAWELSLPGSERTLLAYRRSLRQFCGWLDDHGLDLVSVQRVQVDGWRHEVNGVSTTAASSTVGQQVAAVSSFYRYAVSYGAVITNPAELVKRPLGLAGHSSTQSLSKDQARALLRVARANGPRSYALVSLLLFTGLRISEALNADRSDYGHDSGHRVLTVQRKGGVVATVAVPAPAAEALDAYLGAVAGAGQPIFTMITGQRWAASEAFRTVQRLAHAADIRAEIGLHTLRHTFATLAREAGATRRDLQDSMGDTVPGATPRDDIAPYHLVKSAGDDVARALA